MEFDISSLLFNRRRNSIELKLDHYRKELFYEIENRLEPNSARMSKFDTKLKELKSALIIIDQLLEEEEAMNLVILHFNKALLK